MCWVIHRGGHALNKIFWASQAAMTEQPGGALKNLRLQVCQTVMHNNISPGRTWLYPQEKKYHFSFRFIHQCKCNYTYSCSEYGIGTIKSLFLGKQYSVL